jgi:hypothetical protein
MMGTLAFPGFKLGKPCLNFSPRIFSPPTYLAPCIRTTVGRVEQRGPRFGSLVALACEVQARISFQPMNVHSMAPRLIRLLHPQCRGRRGMVQVSGCQSQAAVSGCQRLEVSAYGPRRTASDRPLAVPYHLPELYSCYAAQPGSISAFGHYLTREGR